MHLDVPNSKQQLCFLTTTSPRIIRIPMIRYSISAKFEKKVYIYIPMDVPNSKQQLCFLLHRH